MLRSAALVLAFAMAACNTAPEEPEEPRYRAQWKPLRDGSYVNIDDRPQFSVASAERCWPVAGGFECLSVFDDNIGDMVRGQRRPSLNNGAPLIGGYRCFRSALGFSETIEDDDGNDVLTRSPDDGSGLMKRAEVEKFMRDNGIQSSSGYVDCAAILDVVDKGSVHTLGTTLAERLRPQ